MRTVKSLQMQIGQTDIADIHIDVTSRDDIPMILLGLQHIYTTLPLRKSVFKILEEVIPHKTAGDSSHHVAVDANKGRPGMDQWCILVLGTLRLGLNADYDRIQELANQHRTLRMMLGHGLFTTDKDYRLQTLKDNLALFTPEIMARINVEVIRAGYQLLDIDIHRLIRGRCDSFVLKTDVHFPTDINLLYDAIRVLIRNCVDWSKDYALPEWRQHQYNLRRFKAQYRKIQKLRHSTSKDESKKRAKEVKICEAHQVYTDLAQFYLDRVARSVEILKNTHKIPEVLLSELAVFSQHANRQIDQIKRRVIEGEKIPHAEKVFSLFQPHTEWISKGKAGVPVELGIRMCIMEDTHGFILHHRVMQKETDDKIALEMVNATQENFPAFNACSFDKGFHSVENQRQLKNQLVHVVLPKKGKLSRADKEREYDEEFIKAKKEHSAVESAINAIQVHGLDKCPDHGIDGFERYAALAVLSRNIQKMGCIVRDRERKILEKQKQAA
ncbi:MAG: ISNCY family transposase [Methylococcales bacterium]|nr:ISNCY family transposase [Methylococcales bacterium]MCK5478848.1 ISNCY family transposase [Methylococcales bacterium]